MPRSPRVQVIANAQPRRRARKPVHSFILKQSPFTIQPFLLAPVLPGETMTQALLSVRAVTDPIKNPLTGWWIEHYLFYVKHSDMQQPASAGGQTVAQELQDMMLNPSWSPADIDQAAISTRDYAFQGAIAWVDHCMVPIVNHYFRDADEDITTAAGLDANSKPMAHVHAPGWVRSFQTLAEADAEDIELLDISAGTTFTGSDDKLKMSELEAAMRQYELLKAGGLVQQTYEEFLATYGVRMPMEALHIPELLRYSREWQYPTNTIDPTSGVARSAVSWVVTERADKNRAFKEPGFIIGVQVIRPKTYFGRQLGAAAGALNSVYQWLPPVLRDDRMASMFAHADAAGGGPLGAFMSTASQFDVKDLYLYGDQFVAGWGTPGGEDGTWNALDLPDAGGNVRYADATDISALFVTATTAEFVRTDGIVDLTIMGRVEDTSHNLGTVG